MGRVRGYRVGGTYTLSAPGNGGEVIDVDLAPGVRVAESGMRRLMLYRDPDPHGKDLTQALQAGWCRVAEPVYHERAA